MLRMRESIASPVCCYSWSALSCWLLLLLICWPLTANYLAAYYCKSAKRFKSFTSTKWLRIWVCSNSWLLPEVQLPPPSETLSLPYLIDPTIPPGIQSLTWLGRLCLPLWQQRSWERDQVKVRKVHFEHLWNPLWWLQWQVCMNFYVDTSVAAISCGCHISLTNPHHYQGRQGKLHYKRSWTRSVATTSLLSRGSRPRTSRLPATLRRSFSRTKKTSKRSRWTFFGGTGGSSP